MVVLVVLLAFTAAGQVQLGENTRLTSNGSVGFGYSGGSSNYWQSAHATYLSAYGTLSGSYYNPNFLSFTVQPYYGRGQQSVGGTSITDSSGVSTTVSVFNGSRFPGSISWGKDLNSISEYSLPGAGSALESGSGSSFGIAWAANVDHWPSLSVGYNSTSSDGEVLGSLGTTEWNSRTFRLGSNYKLLGWRLTGMFNRNSFSSQAPSFLTGAANSYAGDSQSYSVSAGHALPLSGNLDLSWMRSSNGADGTPSFTSENSTASATFSPFTAFSVSGSANYTTNVVGALLNQLGNIPASNLLLNPESHSYRFDFSAGYTIAHRVRVQGYVNRNAQTYGGQTFAFVQYGGSASYNYTRPLFGIVNINVGVTDTASKYGNQGAGFVFNAAARRYFGRWETNLDFSYYQHTQTLIGFYTTSSFSYGATARRRLGDQLSFVGSFRASHSGLSRQKDSGNHSENLSGSLNWRRYNVVGSYSQSSGHSLFDTSGNLTPTVLAPIITNDFINYAGRSYGISAGSNFFRRLTVYGGFNKSLNSTDTPLRSSTFSGTSYDAGMSFRTRKLTFRGAYAQIHQSIEGSPFPPAVVHSYYFNVSRWFNFF